MVRDLTATDAARHFSEVLDAIEHRHESFVIFRNGRPIARIGPAQSATGERVKALLRRHPRDGAWMQELRELRAGLTIEERRWRG